MKSGKFRSLHLHPILFAAFPVLSLLAANIREVEWWVGVRPLLASLSMAAVLYVLLAVVMGRPAKAAIVVSFLIVLFFSYGHVYQLVENAQFLGFVIGRHRFLGPLYLVLLATGIVLLFRVKEVPTAVHSALTLAGVVLLILPVGHLSLSSLQVGAGAKDPSPLVDNSTKNALSAGLKPDIYYIILDMYTRQDALKSEFGLDNSGFLGQLKSMGFYVADCSRSNYSQTEISLASSLNLDYLQNLGKEFTKGGGNSSSMPGMMIHSLARRQLEDIGYKTVAFETGYYWNQWSDATFYLYPKTGSILLQGLQPFEALFVKTTALDIILDGYSVLFKSLADRVNQPYGAHINRQLYLLDQLSNVPAISGPKFVYAHILIPHPPFVFASNGEILTDPGYNGNHGSPVDQAHYLEGYKSQVEFINSRLIRILQDILKDTINPPIIVIQGDHGVNGIHRPDILNAYYLPNGGDKLLYPWVSPVNTFRIIFDHYFSAKNGLLPDISYISDVNRPLDFIEMNDQSQACRALRAQ